MARILEYRGVGSSDGIVRTLVTACFLQSSEDSSLQSQFSLTILLCLQSDTRHYRHINHCFYLLTYLLTYR